MPEISVVMSAYNEERFIASAVKSILSQTFSDFELIIINDGSTDGTKEIVHSFDDDRIKVIDQRNRGLAVALNRGLDAAKGRYIARMDADDLSYPNRLEKQYQYMECHPKIFLCGTGMYRFGRSKGFSISKDDLAENAPGLLRCNIISHPTWFFRNEGSYRIRYDVRYRKSQDYEAVYRLYRDGVKMAWLEDVLLAYRERDRSGEKIDKIFTGEVQKEILKQMRIEASDRMARLVNGNGVKDDRMTAWEYGQMFGLHYLIKMHNRRHHFFEDKALRRFLVSCRDAALDRMC